MDSVDALIHHFWQLFALHRLMLEQEPDEERKAPIIDLLEEAIQAIDPNLTLVLFIDSPSPADWEEEQTEDGQSWRAFNSATIFHDCSPEMTALAERIIAQAPAFPDWQAWMDQVCSCAEHNDRPIFEVVTPEEEDPETDWYRARILPLPVQLPGSEPGCLIWIFIHNLAEKNKLLFADLLTLLIPPTKFRKLVRGIVLSDLTDGLSACALPLAPGENWLTLIEESHLAQCSAFPLFADEAHPLPEAWDGYFSAN